MKRQFTLLALFSAILMLGAFTYSSSSEPQDDWLLGHYKGTVDLGQGDRPVFIHILASDQEAQTIMDNEQGIGCTDTWQISPLGPNSVKLTNFNSNSSPCLPATLIKIENDGESTITASFFNSDQDGSFAIAVFNRYAKVN